MTIKQAVFRADASPEIGSGHVMRCLALAKALEATGGWRCGFASGPQSSAMVPAIRNLAWNPLELTGPAEDEPKALAERWSGGCDLLVVDHYQRNGRFEQACRPWARRIMVIDDLADRDHDCDILLDQTEGRQASDYGGTPSRMLLGPAFALLRPEFLHARSRAIEVRRRGQPVRRILVSLGASDPGNATSQVLAGIAESAIKAAVDVVLGENAPHIEAVRSRIANMPQAAVLHCAPPNMAALMCDADIAIGAAGTTSWERCCLGLPTLALITADNQRFVAAALDGAGAVRLLGRAQDLTMAEISDAVIRLATDHEARVSMTERASRLCDGRGLERIVLAICAPFHGLWLRLASRQDSQLMFEWQCHPETRRFARHPAIPTRDEHDEWIERMLSDANVMLMVVMDGEVPVGVLRLDTVDGPAVREVSIYVAPDRYGQGIAGAALTLAHTTYPSWTFHAEVLPQNQASHALFQFSGYRKLSTTRYIYEPKVALN